MRPLEFTTEELCLEPRLRIALVTETYPPEINGVAMTIQRMVDGLTDAGHRIQLIRPRQASSDTGVNTPAFEELLAHGWKVPRYEGLRFGLPAKAALVRAWSHQRPDLVHVATEGPLGWTAVSAATRLKLPVTSDFHTNFDQYSKHYGVGWLKGPVSNYLRRFHNRTGATFVPTAAMAQDLIRQGYRHVEVVARGVDTTLFDPERRSAELRRNWGVGDTGLTIVYVGRLAAEKNLSLAVSAYRAVRDQCPDARMILVGDGPLRTELMREFPQFVFAGMRIGEDLAAHYASADVFLFPSLSETFGNVTLEAMASGLGVVAYRNAAAAELIRDAENGLTAACGNEDEFIAKAVRAAIDTRLRLRMGTAARRTAEAQSWEAVVDCFAGALLRVWRASGEPSGKDGGKQQPGGGN